jgi:hypothetical protein
LIVESAIREKCPYCQNKLNARATRCKHCHSDLLSSTPTHGGVCPFCQEEIDQNAVKCGHCRAQVFPLIDGSFLYGGLDAASSTALLAQDGGGGGGGGGGWVERCFTIPVPDCHEEPDPIAGYRWVCDGWKLITICIKSPI